MIVDDSVRSADGDTNMVDVLDELMTYDMGGYESRELMEQVVEKGERSKEPDTIEQAKARCREAVMRLDPAVRRFLNPQIYPVGLEPGLAKRGATSRARSAGTRRATRGVGYAA